MAESTESFLDTLKSAIKTSSATAKARAAGTPRQIKQQLQ